MKKANIKYKQIKISNSVLLIVQDSVKVGKIKP
jgi:hypothetical protein